jgi:hypothetical protein
MWKKSENIFGIMVGKHEGRKLILRPGCGLEGDINMDLKEVNGRAWTGFI